MPFVKQRASFGMGLRRQHGRIASGTMLSLSPAYSRLHYSRPQLPEEQPGASERGLPPPRRSPSNSRRRSAISPSAAYLHTFPAAARPPPCPSRLGGFGAQRGTLRCQSPRCWRSSNMLHSRAFPNRCANNGSTLGRPWVTPLLPIQTSLA